MKKAFLLSLTSLVLCLGIMAAPRLALAVPTCGDGTALGDIKCGTANTDAGGPSINSGIGTAVTIMTIVVGFASVIMILLGGYRYITSAGDPNKAAAAKNTILYALIGVVLVALAQLILRFTIAKSLKL